MPSPCFRRHLVAVLLVCLLGPASLVQSQNRPADQGQKQSQEWLRIPGEFEPQRALMLSVCDWQPHHREILTEIVEKTAGHIDVLILYNTREQLLASRDWIQEAQVPTQHVYFHQLQLDSIWLRDFAPIVAECEDGTRAIDFFYYGGARPNDESFPSRWAQQSDSRLLEVKWTVQGGNFLCNGQYAALTTTKIFDENRIQFSQPMPGENVVATARKILTKDLIKQCNLAKLVILEPLQSEETKHVDMFATFVSPTEVVVAQLDPRADPVNAAILDRNARTLERLTIEDKKVNVTRIQIPTRSGLSWSAFTNVIFANNLLLIPKFDSDPPVLVERAKSTYASLLPNHKIETINISSMKQLQGALHCFSAGIPAFSKLPSGAQPFANVR